MSKRRQPDINMDVVRAEVAKILGCDFASVPKVFAGSKPWPMKAAILHDLTEAYPIADVRVLHDWLGDYMSSRAYLTAVVTDDMRYDMDCAVTKPIGERTRAVAKRRLALLSPPAAQAKTPTKRRSRKTSQPERDVAYA